MEAGSLQKEILFNASPAEVWKAITQPALLRQWFFDVSDFKAEPGFEFTFIGGKKHQYIHHCKVLEVVPNKKLVFMLPYEGNDDQSIVTFELQPAGNKTKFVLTHTGIVPVSNPDFAKASFEKGWSHLIETALPKLLENTHHNGADYHATIQVNDNSKDVYQKIAQVGNWWNKNFKGKAMHTGDTFTIQFGKTTVDFAITEAIPYSKIVWHVTDCHLDWLNDKKEWKGNDIVWELQPDNDTTKVNMTHVGLVPGIECYDNCENGWNGFVKGSLMQFINEGKGKPE